ncbi:MAG: diacylglycerol kinase family lipid kinase [Armatimonadaceae bacterium]
MEHLVSEGGAVIYNPTAGRGHGGGLVEQAKSLIGSGFEWIPTQRAGHAVELAREAAKNHQIVAAFGGDGTVSDVAKGLFGTEATLGIIPVGTGNDYARNLNLPLDLPEAINTVLNGVVRRVDVGIINDIPFINNAGTGFDAQVMETMNTSIRFTKGRPAFMLAILKNFVTYKPFTVQMTINDDPPRKERALMISVLNGKMYGAGMQAAPHADMDDGLLDVLLIKSVPKFKLISVIAKIGTGQHLGEEGVEMLKVRSLKIEATPTQPLNVDGDIRGATPATISIKPRAMKVLVR